MTILTGKKVLVLEDEARIAEDLHHMLEDLGCAVVAVVGTIEAALGVAISSDIYIAILDINIHGKDCVAIAKALRLRGVPFLLVTGKIPERSAKFGEAPILLKPYLQDELRDALVDLLGRD